ncbi:uncharacterized protein LOC110856633 [Folsomia candida]|uniref:uncharacterized protein LOC110856633 n=1 Tax=Folsomia candida TaxID=158441 RepID=UPI0016050DDD|nr:uncharacterized protein LOC110856633 [Folsomia candida]
MMDFENVEIVPDTLKSEFDPSPFDTRHEIPYNSETFADEEDECYLPSPSKKIIRRDNPPGDIVSLQLNAICSRMTLSRNIGKSKNLVQNAKNTAKNSRKQTLEVREQSEEIHENALFRTKSHTIGHLKATSSVGAVLTNGGRKAAIKCNQMLDATLKEDAAIDSDDELHPDSKDADYSIPDPPSPVGE